MKTILVSLLLAFCLLMESCSASAHLGKANVSKPDANEADSKIWFKYYEDQLDAYGGNAIAPIGEALEAEGYQPMPGTYNQAAIDGYQQAVLEWGVKQRQADKGKAAGIAGGVLAMCLIPVVLVFSLIHTSPTHP